MARRAGAGARSPPDHADSRKRALGRREARRGRPAGDGRLHAKPAAATHLRKRDKARADADDVAGPHGALRLRRPAMPDRKTLVLTGASRGIGHATVKRFSDAGWKIFTCSREGVPAECRDRKST